ncbi:hypothetical protein KAR91_76820 [Candidatus Pacearchaeota archaeon]|nr:hypothetical protein [Candidatus Pacearchaeota archaeon]
MKYFIANRAATWEDIQRRLIEQDCEITKKRAFNMYKERAGKGNLNLIAIPNFNKGLTVFIRQGTIRLWGERISEEECFRRRLIGSLHPEVQD